MHNSTLRGAPGHPFADVNLRTSPGQSPGESSSRSRPGRMSPFALAAAVTAVSIGLLSGCGLAAAPPPAAKNPCPDTVLDDARIPVLVATATSAEPRVRLPGPLRDKLTALAQGNQPACLAIVTPQGTRIGMPVTPMRGTQVEHGQSRSRKLDKNLDAIEDRLSRLAATSEGLDLGRAISQAAGLHQRHPGTLWVISSGVSTVAPIDFRTLGWDTDPATVARILRDSGWLPDLAGWHVTLFGLGSVSGRQPDLTQPLLPRLNRFWGNLCAAMHAASCTIDPERVPRQPGPVANNPVPVVPVQQEIPDLAPPTTTGPRQPVSVPLRSTIFDLDSATLSPLADAVLRQVVRAALSYRCTVALVGHTDAITGSNSYNLNLSRARAQAVAERLATLGLPSSQFSSVLGVGSNGASAAAERRDPAQVSADRNVTVNFTCHS